MARVNLWLWKYFSVRLFDKPATRRKRTADKASSKQISTSVYKVKHTNLSVLKYFKDTENLYLFTNIDVIPFCNVFPFSFSIPGRVMEAKSLVVVFLVSCVFLSVCLQPASSQGLRWGREFEEEHPKIERVKADYLRRKQMQETFDDSTEKGKKKI